MAFISKVVLLGIHVTRKIVRRFAKEFHSAPIPWLLSCIRLLLHPVHRIVYHPSYGCIFQENACKANVRNEIAGICLFCGRRTDHCSRLGISLFIERDNKEPVKRRNQGRVGDCFWENAKKFCPAIDKMVLYKRRMYL